jgi:hypothetical protein
MLRAWRALAAAGDTALLLLLLLLLARPETNIGTPSKQTLARRWQHCKCCRNIRPGVPDKAESEQHASGGSCRLLIPGRLLWWTYWHRTRRPSWARAGVVASANLHSAQPVSALPDPSLPSRLRCTGTAAKLR